MSTTRVLNILALTLVALSIGAIVSRNLHAGATLGRGPRVLHSGNTHIGI
jgi:hypothetical protein